MQNAWVVRVLLGAILAFPLAANPPSATPDRRQVKNGWEIRNEITVPPGAEMEVKDYFLSFRDYQELVLYDSKGGYYASGRVNFVQDYYTFPNTLAPFFGQMIAVQLFRMWEGMRRAGTLGPRDRFTIAEFGGGNGEMARSILGFLNEAQQKDASGEWLELWQQVMYVSYDRSPAMVAEQRVRNSQAGERFEAREGDATNPASLIAAGSIQGVVLSNEMLDNFCVHKVVLSLDGLAEVAFVAPTLPPALWSRLEKRAPEPLLRLIENDDRVIRDRFFHDAEAGARWLSRTSFVALLEWLASLPDYPSLVNSILFHEIYVPARAIPELADHLRRYARPYACELAKLGRDVVTYISLDEGKFMEGVGRILRAGYVLTIDYGSNWDGILAPAPYSHLRSYGPGHRRSDPYRDAGLNDITTDVNFSLVAAEGQSVGLNTAFYGRQRALQTGTPIKLNELPPDQLVDARAREYNSRLEYFKSSRAFKLLVQQKENTDAAYIYPDPHRVPLDVDEAGLRPLQRTRAVEIEKKLSAAVAVTSR
jgi:SAM-dependent MidA family methyltransferase